MEGVPRSNENEGILLANSETRMIMPVMRLPSVTAVGLIRANKRTFGRLNRTVEGSPTVSQGFIYCLVVEHSKPSEQLTTSASGRTVVPSQYGACMKALDSIWDI